MNCVSLVWREQRNIFTFAIESISGILFNENFPSCFSILLFYSAVSSLSDFFSSPPFPRSMFSPFSPFFRYLTLYILPLLVAFPST